MADVPLPAPIHFEEILGDTWAITMAFQDETGTAESHSGSTWRGQVKTSQTGSAFASFTFDTASAASGLVTATIAAATTATATVGTYYHYDIEETTSGGAVVTHMRGTVVWAQDTSRA